jgi:hypothetical protein
VFGGGRNRTRREAQQTKPKENPSGAGGHSGPPLRRGFVAEHAVKPNIQNHMKIRQAREGTAALPYAEALCLTTRFDSAYVAWAERRVWWRPEA